MDGDAIEDYSSLVVGQRLSPSEGLSSRAILLPTVLKLSLIPRAIEHGVVVLFTVSASPSGFGIILHTYLYLGTIGVVFKNEHRVDRRSPLNVPLRKCARGQRNQP